ncbi:hypothetical protein E1N52_35030 [Paraburkholderia guartelaensis]|uniref:Uncharacterized protein n=1 Tax=Paraburkholderia guartelaensis TaxID=2546446 RepID=A0A4R5L639_9BURK|nr:hypothetical protein E1N52_35030 [Paraburkholderia guartelaensis]
MDNAKGGTAGPTGTRRPRQGEAFWREMVMTWEASGLGVRRCLRRPKIEPRRGLCESDFRYEGCAACGRGTPAVAHCEDAVAP